MNAHNEIDLERIFQDRPDPSQRLGSLTLAAEVLSNADYLERLTNLAERAKQLAGPLPNGKQGTEAKDTTAVVPSNFITPRRAVSQTEEGVLELDFFIYAPPDNHDLSVNAGWYLPGQDRPKRVRQVYLSARNFNDKIAAYRKNSPEVLAELEAALDIYEQAAETTPTA